MKYFFSRFKFLRARDFFSFFVLFLVLIPALITKMFVRDFWLICEDKNEARDNGYWLFRYIRKNYKRQKVAYAINKKSVDYNKVKDLGKVISFGGISHWFWYVVAGKNISSQKNGKPNAAVCYFFEVVLGMRKKNRIFLQHGVTINDVEFLHYKNSKISRFCTSTIPEHEFITNNFGYPKGNIVLTGFARFDGLNNKNLDKKTILCMPTWRNWISKQVECKKYEETTNFVETEYYKAWHDFITSSELATFLDRHDYTLIFYPHRNMQKYIQHFNTTSDRIIIANSKEYDVQELLNKAGLLITDFSSVFFDFAYLGKPIIFYQFDEAKFRKGQYKEGYFDYKNTELASWTNNIAGVIEKLNEKQSEVGSVDKEKAKKYFKYVDSNNCERIYRMIKNENFE